MLKAVFRKKNGSVCMCSVSGHAGYAKRGQDVVCAAVSSAVQLSANLITESFGEPAEVLCDESANGITIRLTEGCSKCAASVLDMLLIHLCSISEEFPNTMQFDISEV